MEFNFNINNYFKDEIVKIGSRLIPEGFVGDRREVQDCLSKVSYILTVLGEKSANAQGLQKVITSGEKLRNSDHVVYVLIDPKGGSKGYGAVLGMLKVGIKHLYVFDAGGNSHEVTTKCILDFYVHESKQRMGLGKKLFQYMLKEERVDPVHLAIDKPSSKFLSFLVKHYGLETIIPQMNNFVVFNGFFSNRPFGGGGGSKDKEIYAAGVSSCGSQYSSGSPGFSTTSSPTQSQYNTSPINMNHTPYFGRPAPHKPVSTMGMILQHKPPPSQQPPQNGSAKEDKPENPPVQFDIVENPAEENPQGDEGDKLKEDDSVPEAPAQEEKETREKVDEVVQAQEEVAKVVLQASEPISPADYVKTPMGIANGTKSRLNSQGHLDLKFYHSSLW